MLLALVGAACLPLHEDNRAQPIYGATNGQIRGGWLTPVRSGCVVYWEAAVSLDRMVAQAAKDGVTLTPSSCYRDHAGQVAARQSWCSLGACHMAAVPGTSNHGWGKAADFREGNKPMTYDSPGYQWLLTWGGHFGWLHPKVMKQDGPVPEPWHWEWVGDGGKMAPGGYFGLHNRPPLSGSPIGNVDRAAPVLGGVELSGWALDPDQQEPTSVHAYVNGRGIAGWRADRPRNDVAGALPAYASRPHGFKFTIPLPPGRHHVCVFGIEVTAPGSNSTLGCRMVVVGVGTSDVLPYSGSPFGSLDVVRGVPGGVQVAGWTIDPDQTEPTSVHVYADGRGIAGWRADRPRGDVRAAFPAYGAHHHGFSFTFALSPGRHHVCAYPIDSTPPGANSTLGCRWVDVPAPASSSAAPEPSPTSTTSPPSTSAPPATATTAPPTTSTAPSTTASTVDEGATP